MFLPVLTGGTLMTTDDNIGHIAGYQKYLPDGLWSGTWRDAPLVGMPESPSPLNWSNTWMLLLSSRAFANFFHGLSLLAGSLALGWFLLRKGLAPVAVALGIIAAFWVGSNFTLVHAGHIRKFSIVFLFCANLLVLDLLFERKQWGWAALSGFLLALMFLEQQDVALFFGLFLGAYALFLAWRSGEKLRGVVRLLPIPVVSLMIAFGTMLSAYRQNAEGAAATRTDNKQEQWEFCTQWSWPPEESIDFIARGYTGWRSGEPEGPYWGRMGRSAGWEQTRQGFMNFKLENTYLGFVPVFFAIFALGLASGSTRRAEIYFWGGATVLALLLAFGKYFPLYRIFWELPVIHTIRNPNKFLQVFQVGLAILAAYGFDALMRNRDEKKLKLFWWGSLGALGVLLLWAIGTLAGQSGVAAEFAQQGWPTEMARVIAANQAAAMGNATLMAALVAGLLAVFTVPALSKWRAHGGKLALTVVAIVAIDAVLLSGSYVKTLPRGYIEENDITRYLKDQPGHQRVAVVTQESFYNLWLTYLFPYHDIVAFNFTQMPRMLEEYQQFLGALGRNPLRLWQLGGVGYLAGPSNMEGQLPPGQYETVLRFDVTGEQDGGIKVIPNPKGGHVVLKSLIPAPRFALVGGAEKLPDDRALARLAASDWKPFERVILPPDSPVEALGEPGYLGEMEILDYRPGYARLRGEAKVEGFLRMADKFDSGWMARVNGEAVDVVRADYLFAAVPVPAGPLEVELIYQPSRAFTWMQLAGFGLCFIAVVTLPFQKRV